MSGPPPGYNENASALPGSGGGSDVHIMRVMGGGGAPANYNGESLLHGGEGAAIIKMVGGDAAEVARLQAQLVAAEAAARDANTAATTAAVAADPAKQYKKVSEAMKVRRLKAKIELEKAEDALGAAVGPATASAAAAAGPGAPAVAAGPPTPAQLLSQFTTFVASAAAEAEKVIKAADKAIDTAALFLSERGIEARKQAILGADAAIVEAENAFEKLGEFATQAHDVYGDGPNKPTVGQPAFPIYTAGMTAMIANIEKCEAAINTAKESIQNALTHLSSLKAIGKSFQVEVYTPTLTQEVTEELNAFIQTFNVVDNTLHTLMRGFIDRALPKINRYAIHSGRMDTQLPILPTNNDAAFDNARASSKIVDFIDINTNTIIVVPPVKGNLKTYLETIEYLAVNDLIEENETLAPGVALIFMAPFFGSAANDATNKQLLYSILHLQEKNRSIYVMKEKDSVESFNLGKSFYTGFPAPANSSQLYLLNYLNPSYLILPRKAGSADGLVFSFDEPIKGVKNPVTKAAAIVSSKERPQTIPSTTIYKYIPTEYVLEEEDVDIKRTGFSFNSTNETDVYFNKYLSFFSNDGDSSTEYVNKAVIPENCKLDTMFYDVDIKGNVLKFSTTNKVVLIRFGERQLPRICNDEQGAIQKQIPTELMFEESEDYFPAPTKELFIEGVRWEFRISEAASDLDQVFNNWKHARYTQSEADFLNYLKLSPKFLATLFSKEGEDWKVEVANFLANIVVSECFDDTSILSHGNCEDTRKFLTKVRNALFEQKIELHEKQADPLVKLRKDYVASGGWPIEFIQPLSGDASHLLINRTSKEHKQMKLKNTKAEFVAAYTRYANDEFDKLLAKHDGYVAQLDQFKTTAERAATAAHTLDTSERLAAAKAALGSINGAVVQAFNALNPFPIRLDGLIAALDAGIVAQLTPEIQDRLRQVLDPLAGNIPIVELLERSDAEITPLRDAVDLTAQPAAIQTALDAYLTKVIETYLETLKITNKGFILWAKAKALTFFAQAIEKLIEVFTTLRGKITPIVGLFPALIAAAAEATRLRADADANATDATIQAAKAAESALTDILVQFDTSLSANQIILLMMDQYIKTAATFASGGASLSILKYDQTKKLLYTSDDFAKVLISELEEDYPNFIFVDL